MTTQRRTAIISVTALVAMATWGLLPGSFDESTRRVLAIFAVAAIFWATEALPLYATSLLTVGFLVLFMADPGGLATHLPAVSVWEHGPFPYTRFLESFGSPIIILFMGGFLLSAALSRHGADRAIAARVLAPVAGSPRRLLAAVLATSAFFSMWMSNTATTAMMLAILAPALAGMPREAPFGRCLVLAVAFGATIGGLATPIGTLPNAVAFGMLHRAGWRVSFLEWVAVGLPLAVGLLAVTGGVLYRMFPPGDDEGGAVRFEAPNRLGPRGVATATVLGITIALWLTADLHGIRPAAVALLAAAALTAGGLIGRSEVDSIDWNILILMWGGLALGDAMGASGLPALIGGLDAGAVPGGAWGLGLVTAVVAVTVSTFMSNTAAANLLVPLALSLSAGAATESAMLAILVAFACSLALALPVSTPPNALAYATGRVPAPAMVRAGTVVSVLGVIVLVAGYRWVLPWVV